VSASISFRSTVSNAAGVLSLGPFTTEVAARKRDNGITAPIKRKSHDAAIARENRSGRGGDALDLLANLGTDRAVNRRVRTSGSLSTTG
jgi:hypothetical protein